MIIHTHIPKTAGSSFLEIAMKNVVVQRKFHKELKDLSPASVRKSTQFINGHIPYGIHRRVRIAKPKYIVFLRDPISRWKSSFYHFLMREDMIAPLWRSTNCNLEKFLEVTIKHEMNTNTMTKQLSGTEKFDNVYGKKRNMYIWAGRKSVYSSGEMDEMLNASINNLKSYFFVGLQNDADAHYKKLTKKLHWKFFKPKRAQSTAQKRNLINKKFSIDFNNQTVVEMLNVVNYYDLKLYKQVTVGN